MIKKLFIFSFIVAVFLTSCSDEEFGPVLSVGTAPSITSPAAGASIVLTESTAEQVFPKFNWTAAEFGFPAGVKYTLELDLAGNNFAAPVTVGTVNALSLEVTEGKINSILLSKGRPGNAVTAVEFRVKAELNPDVDPVYSSPLSLNITPFEAVIVYPKLQVPGNYQGWDPSKETTVIYSLKSDGKFEGYIYFPDPNAEYKFTDGPSWDVNYGDTGADGTLDPGGDNILLTTAGMYRLSVDLNTLTHSNAKTDWGLVGSATPGGWDTDQDMTYDPESGTLRITLDLAAGDIKFRANDDWAINLGDNDANGSLEQDGSNIAVAEAGNYTIELILNVPVYTYKITRN